MIERVMTLGQDRVALADTLVTRDRTPIDLTGSTVFLRMLKDVTEDGQEYKAGDVLFEELPVNIDDPVKGDVSFGWTEEVITLIRAAVEEGADTFWYWWIVETAGKRDRHPGDGLSARIRFVTDY